ncbi:MAG: 3-oxoacyl-ACP reductase FabG [Acidobacteria bacterium]|nr:3-oxoacyl-ACP reductase FabG [Acidobacteriota bacterium]
MTDGPARVAIVTGGARGIGRAIVLRLVRDGWSVAFTFRSSADAATSLAAEADAERLLALEGDVSDAERCAAIVDEVIARFGRVDALINNAGIRRDTLVYNMSDDDWSDVLRTNLDGAFHMTRAVLSPMMRQRSGSIVNVSSLSGLHAVVGQANYAASKAGLIALTRTLARECGRSGIRVNCVAPGLVATDMTAGMDPAAKSEMLKSIPMRRMVTADEVAAAIAFFLGNDSSGITGQTLCVDGGTTA